MITTLRHGHLMKKEKKPINFVVEKFISQGVHFLAGHPKSGKSWLSLWLALCVSNGNNLWGFKTNKSKVLYFCLEDTENRIQDRLEGMPGCDTDNLLFMYDAPNMDNGFDVFLKKIVKEEPEIKLVIVDTFQLIRGEQFAGNAYACEYAEMNYLKKLAKELDITIILVHHLRKMHDSSPQNMISGSTALAGGADTTFVLYTFPKRKGYGILYCKGRDTDIREIELRFGFGTHIWDKISDSVEDSDGMKMVEIITKLLDESGPFSGTATELCKLIKEVCDVEFTAPILGTGLHQFDDTAHQNRGYESPDAHLGSVEASMTAQIFEPDDQAKAAIHGRMGELVETGNLSQIGLGRGEERQVENSEDDAEGEGVFL